MSRRLVATVALMNNIMLPFMKVERPLTPISPLTQIYSEEEFEAIKTRTFISARVPNSPNLMQKILELSDIYYRVCRQHRGDGEESLESLTHRAQEWRTSLPEALKHNKGNFDAHQAKFALRPFMFMHTLNEHVWQLIYLDLLRWDTDVFSSNRPRVVEPPEVYKYAICIADMVHETHKTGAFDIHNACFGQIITVSTVVLTHWLISSRDRVEAEMAQRRILTLRDYLIRVKDQCRLYN